MLGLTSQNFLRTINILKTSYKSHGQGSNQIQNEHYENNGYADCERNSEIIGKENIKACLVISTKKMRNELMLINTYISFSGVNTDVKTNHGVSIVADKFGKRHILLGLGQHWKCIM